MQVLPDNVFCMCRALTEVHLPEGIPVIESGTFHMCVSLAEITLPDSVKKICNSAFSDCKLLQTVSVAEGTEIGQNVFPYAPNAKVVFR